MTKITDLIQFLETQLTEHGDIEVMISGAYASEGDIYLKESGLHPMAPADSKILILASDIMSG